MGLTNWLVEKGSEVAVDKLTGALSDKMADFAESIGSSSKIREINEEAQKIYDQAYEKLTEQRENTTDSLNRLAEVKINAWAEGMDAFADAFGAFKGVEIIQKSDTNNQLPEGNIDPAQMMIRINQASITASEIAKAGFAAVGTGALVGIAAYGGVMMFGTATTGTAIAKLSGAAKKNATLAWFGGGAKSLNGFGMNAGKCVLAGIVLASVFAVGAVIYSARQKERLAEAKKNLAESKKAASEMKVVIREMKSLSKLADQYTSFIGTFGKEFTRYINELKRVKKVHQPDDNGCIDFDSLSSVEQKTLHVSWLMAQVYYHLLSTPILTSDGKISDEAVSVLDTSENEMRTIQKEPIARDIAYGSKATCIMVFCFFALGVLLALGVTTIANNILKGIIFIICSVIACPVFFILKLPKRKVFAFRLLRLIVSITIAIAAVILL